MADPPQRRGRGRGGGRGARGRKRRAQTSRPPPGSATPCAGEETDGDATRRDGRLANKRARGERSGRMRRRARGQLRARPPRPPPDPHPRLTTHRRRPPTAAASRRRLPLARQSPRSALQLDLVPHPVSRWAGVWWRACRGRLGGGRAARGCGRSLLCFVLVPRQGRPAHDPGSHPVPRRRRRGDPVCRTPVPRGGRGRRGRGGARVAAPARRALARRRQGGARVGARPFWLQRRLGRLHGGAGAGGRGGRRWRVHGDPRAAARCARVRCTSLRRGGVFCALFFPL